ncbi:hypothetical protein BDR26DRAFT_959768 [Obelidium mucronatum]|nr:hypothetical protein BDR26DRAFT_959768 [Obelidium mucronatum]
MTFESALTPSTFAIALFEVVFLMVIAALVACDAMTCFLAWRQRPQDHQALECEHLAVLAECETLKGLSEILSLANTRLCREAASAAAAVAEANSTTMAVLINRGRVFMQLDASREECRELKEKLWEALERERDLEEDLVRMTRFEELGAREILKLKSDFLDLEIHHSAILKLGAAAQKAQEEKVEAQSQRETLELLNQLADLKNQLELLSVASLPLVESASAETQISPQEFVSLPVAELVPNAVALLPSTSDAHCILLSEVVSTNAVDVVECCNPPPAVQVLAIASPSRTATPCHISAIPATAVVIVSRSPVPEEAISTPFPVATPLDSVPYPVASADHVDVPPPSVQVFATPSPAIASIECILNINSTPFTLAVTTVTSPVDIEVVVPVTVLSPAAAPIEAPMMTPFEDVSALPPAIVGAIEIVGVIVPVDSVTALSELIPARIATTVPKPTVSVKERVRLLEESHTAATCVFTATTETSVLEDSTEELAVAFRRLDLTAGFGQVNEAMDLDLAETVQFLDAAPAAEPALLETYAEQVILAVSQSTVVALDLQDDDVVMDAVAVELVEVVHCAVAVTVEETADISMMDAQSAPAARQRQFFDIDRYRSNLTRRRARARQQGRGELVQPQLDIPLENENQMELAEEPVLEHDLDTVMTDAAEEVLSVTLPASVALETEEGSLELLAACCASVPLADPGLLQQSLSVTVVAAAEESFLDVLADACANMSQISAVTEAAAISEDEESNTRQRLAAALDEALLEIGEEEITSVSALMEEEEEDITRQRITEAAHEAFQDMTPEEVLALFSWN